MSKKHGFRGTPVRPSPRPGTMGRVFETRGDPMATDKEGRKNYGRNLETENPDYDRMFTQRAEDVFAPLARDLLKPQQVDKANAFRKLTAKDTYDPQRKAAQIMLETRAKVKKAELGPRVAQVLREDKRKQDGVLPDNIPAKTLPGSEAISRQKQTPSDAPSKSYYDFTGKSPPKEIKKHGKIYRRK